MELIVNQEYHAWLAEVKSKVRNVRVKAALAANRELIHFYFDLGKMILIQLEKSTWGDKLLPQLSKDLAADFPDMKGFLLPTLSTVSSFINFTKAQLVNSVLTNWGNR